MELNRVELTSVNEQNIIELMANDKVSFAQKKPGNMEQVQLRGMLQMVLRRKDGSGLYAAHENLITTAGFNLICDVLGKNTQPSDLTHIGIGTGGTAAAVAQTSLVTSVARQSAVYAHVAGTKVMTLVSTFAPGTGTGNIVEAGSFNAQSGGTMFNRVVFNAVNKAAADSLTTTFTFTFS